ncbi:MAG TPA: cob(I)yrinic acid a,c-diamide adenosyltransferase [Candidatus Poseidoniales archaeon]|nr:MAG: ATP:cob(I)alamin adenosyltransferase [Euryarchaeota archaeon]HIG02918.1 cob(I)yrinic acid a,c-diamide adenosyltransferase [Candidatus Poseidoniales archaeon]HIK77813.1 cob(I)yrinic acid a,c-diamide adenosyltransferase [Candidatus Poseidoniales archaeon]
MVRINRVHTGGGDSGDTSLVDGTRVLKSSPRLGVVGDTDELNSMLGVVLMEINNLPDRHQDGGFRPTVRRVQDIASTSINRIQQELFDIGAELACSPGKIPEGIVLLDEISSDRLVEEMDAWIEELEPLPSFIIPTGKGPVAWLHVARTITRRLERGIVGLRETEGDDSIRDFVLIYLNRLSDWCFVLSRWISSQLGEKENLWLPVGKRQKSKVSKVKKMQENDEMSLEDV